MADSSSSSSTSSSSSSVSSISSSSSSVSSSSSISSSSSSVSSSSSSVSSSIFFISTSLQQAIDYYNQTQTYVTSFQEKYSDIITNIELAASYVNDNEVPSEDIIKTQTYNVFIKKRNDVRDKYYLTYSQDLKDTVKYLQNYITIKYGSVDNFLSNSNYKVSIIFAEISREVGYPIDGAYVERRDVS